ncbi:MAG: cation acetate symporter [Planctomycetota bacterium]|nr:MAG: cation acetate symporter [Planctomycetota bacterium]
MTIQAWTFVIVGLSFALYIGIAIRTRAKSTGDFYVAGKGVHPVANGMATAADWMSAASFISMAGIISFAGYDGSVYLMGWTGGYVLLALLLAPYLRKFGKFTVPDFVGDRYYSQFARLVAVLCAIFISFTYVAGQMRGVGVVFSRFLEVDITLGVLIGMGLVFFYAVLGGMKGITYTQVAQYCVLIFAFMVPAIFISIMLTNNPIPQLGFGGQLAGDLGSQIAAGEQVHLLDKLDGLHKELGFAAYTDGSKPVIDVFCITLALMVGTAGLPHVIIRFYTVPKVRDARISAGWALLFIAILYTSAPAVAAFARTNLIASTEGAYYNPSSIEQIADPTEREAARAIPSWFANWEDTGLLAWADKNGDGRVQYRKGAAFDGKPDFVTEADMAADVYTSLTGPSGERLIKNTLNPTNDNELYIDRDIMVLANPEIARLPNWVVGLVAAGGLAAAALDGGRAAAGRLDRHQPRPAQARLQAEYHREAGTDRRPHRGRGRSGGRRVPRHQPAGIRRRGRRVRLRPRGLQLLPGHPPRHLRQTRHPRGRRRRHDRGHHLHHRLHPHVPVRLRPAQRHSRRAVRLGARHGQEGLLPSRHLPRRHRRGRHGDQLRRLLHRQHAQPRTPGRGAGTGRADPGARRRGRGTRDAGAADVKTRLPIPVVVPTIVPLRRVRRPCVCIDNNLTPHIRLDPRGSDQLAQRRAQDNLAGPVLNSLHHAADHLPGRPGGNIQPAQIPLPLPLPEDDIRRNRVVRRRQLNVQIREVSRG